VTVNSIKFRFGIALSGMILVFGLTLWTSCAQKAEESSAQTMVPGLNPAERGKYLVTIMGCGDCHSPHDNQGQIIAGKELTGYWKGAPVPEWNPDMLKNKNTLWAVGTDFTAFAGPWGISKAKNLTPDKETGIGNLSEQEFVDVFKKGNLLPPMRLNWYGKMDEDDLRAIYAYLHNLPPVNNGNVEEVKKAEP
jgi:hypothetical protein